MDIGQESSVAENLTSGARVPGSIPGPAGFFVSLYTFLPSLLHSVVAQGTVSHNLSEQNTDMGV